MRLATKPQLRQDEPSNAARDDLRAAIERKHAAERDVVAGRNAVEVARDRLYDTMAKLERIENPQLDGEEGETVTRDVGAQFSEALQAGHVPNVDELADDDEQETIAKIKRDIETWRRTIKSCEAVLPEKERAVVVATEEIESAAGEVIRAAAGGAVGALIAGLEEMQALVLMRRLQLHFFACNRLIPAGEYDRVMAALAPLHLPGRPSDVYHREWNRHPAWLAWKGALDALHGDADAPLPEEGTP